MAEQLRLDERFWYGPAIERDERSQASIAQLVNGLRHELFTRSGFAQHEHGEVRRGNHADLLDNLLYGLARPHLQSEALGCALFSIASELRTSSRRARVSSARCTTSLISS